MLIPDACPDRGCWPPAFPASLPLETGSDGSALYECSQGHRWRAAFDLYGWVIIRRLITPSPSLRPGGAPDTRSEAA